MNAHPEIFIICSSLYVACEEKNEQIILVWSAIYVNLQALNVSDGFTIVTYVFLAKSLASYYALYNMTRNKINTFITFLTFISN